MSKTAAAVENYAATFQAETFKVQLKNRKTEQGFWVEYSPAQLVAAVGYLRKQNFDGFDIYARPVGYQYVLLDDLTRDVLTDLQTLKPCLLMETSPANFQAWLILPEVPADRETAKAICKELAQRFGADQASAEPDHVGRLPGFTNRKEKHQLSDGRFPFVRLHKWKYRVSTFYPNGAAVLHNAATSTVGNTANPPVATSGRSEKDYGVACGMVRKGNTNGEIFQHLLTTSPDLVQRKGKHVERYLLRTIDRARKSVGRF